MIDYQLLIEEVCTDNHYSLEKLFNSKQYEKGSMHEITAVLKDLGYKHAMAAALPRLSENQVAGIVVKNRKYPNGGAL